MAMEINSKNLHKHALPLVVAMLAIFTFMSVLLLQHRPSLSRGLEALFGQQHVPSQSSFDDLGGTAQYEIQSK